VFIRREGERRLLMPISGAPYDTTPQSFSPRLVSVTFGHNIGRLIGTKTPDRPGVTSVRGRPSNLRKRIRYWTVLFVSNAATIRTWLIARNASDSD
jgi:hypothetical protein